MSNIDPSKPVYGNPTTQSVRDNFNTAKIEIEALEGKTNNAPFLPLAGGTITGPLLLSAAVTISNQATTKQYVDTFASQIFPDAPANHLSYGRLDNTWTRVIATTNDVFDGGNF